MVCEEKTEQQAEEEDEIEEDVGEEVIPANELEAVPVTASLPLTLLASSRIRTREASSSTHVQRTREKRTPCWLADYEVGENALAEEEEDLNALMMLMMVTEHDPIRFEDAEKQKNWREAMIRKIDSIKKNQTWELMAIPESVTPIGVKWVYKAKLNKDGKVEKYKARLVAKGYA